MNRTGVFATAEEIANIKAAVNTPVMMIGGVMPQSAQQVAHAYARAHGLPEVPGYYGIDLTNGEFVSA